MSDEYPSGWEVIDQLPKDISDEYILDEGVCENYNGKNFFIAAVDAAAQHKDKQAANILRMIRAQAGESEAALRDWERLCVD